MNIEEYLIDYFPFEKSEIIDFLNKKAKQGLKINGISESDNIWTFIETDNKNIHYDIYLFGEILPDIEFYDSCKLMGWNFLFRTNNFAIFYNEDKVPPLPLIDKSMDKDLETGLYNKVIFDIRKTFHKCIIFNIMWIPVLFLLFWVREYTLYNMLFLSIGCALLLFLLSVGYCMILSDLKKKRKIKLRPVIIQILSYFIYQPILDILFLSVFDIPVQILNIIIVSFLILNIILILYLRKNPHSPLLQKLYKNNFFITTAISLLILSISGIFYHLF